MRFRSKGKRGSERLQPGKPGGLPGGTPHAPPAATSLTRAGSHVLPAMAPGRTTVQPTHSAFPARATVLRQPTESLLGRALKHLALKTHIYCTRFNLRLWDGGSHPRGARQHGQQGK